ncbi:trypsin-like serine protease [Shewanella sp. JM162201]|uniref:Trypsin-like serine protease n=1 Tax=Shewanella jiangmenensis TaxID=2837387 RepID=A0ABS5V8M9_9GAMM|nr:trypsin-like serine protease [Shewanella jiangmenensis]MBT1445363.1 trypsin-like serine protease [Shewanella jiangmenensis]
MKWMLLISLLISCASEAIIIRHDAADTAYIELAKTDNSTVSFYGVYKGKEFVAGTGSLISNQWIVTAAHVAKDLVIGGKVQFKDDTYHIEKVIRHPLWKDQQFPNDIALVKLSSAVTNATIAKLYDSSNEIGKVVTFVGRGDNGDGVTGVVGADEQLRAANNVVTAADEQWLRFVFDRGTDALPLEGISGPGDSGGPAYLYSDDAVCILGVSSWQNAEATGWEEGKYGVTENYSRISHFKSWIEQTMLQESQPAPEACPNGDAG